MYHLFIVLLNKLDREDRRAYEVAVATVPALVEKESPIADFLSVENNNPVRAAVRLANYWKARRNVFGEDRWLLPMNQASPFDIFHLD